jgi:hypothetical protein
MRQAPLPVLVERALRARGPRRVEGEARVGGVSIPVRYPTLAAVREALGPAFSWGRTYGLGICLPGPDHRRWVEDRPQTFGALAMMERLLRSMPLLRGLGDHMVIEGRRT